MHESSPRRHARTDWPVRRPLLRALVLLPFVVLVCVSASRADMMLIDNFSNPDPSVGYKVLTGASQVHLTQSAPDALGGQRDILVVVDGTATPTSARGQIGLNRVHIVPVNELQLGTNGFLSSVLTAQYNVLSNPNAAAAQLNPLGIASGLDFTAGGNDRFLVRFNYSDATPSAGLQVTVTIRSPGGLESSSTKVVPNTSSVYDLFIAYSTLTGSASITNVESVKFTFNTGHTQNVDFAVQLLGAVPSNIPEPGSGTLMLIALGLLTLSAHGVRRRRTRPAAPTLRS
jgi:hypothetical protein